MADRFATTPKGIRRWARRLKRRCKGQIVCCYEAGPLGYGLQRTLMNLGVECIVIAPSLIPSKPGDRIKTDRRDSRKLAELLAAGLLTEVHVPTPEQEAIRDLCRSRGGEKGDQKRIQRRLSKFLLRRAIRWTSGRKMWTGAHRQWLRGRRLEHAADQDILDDHLLALEQNEGRLAALDEKLAHWATQEPYGEGELSYCDDGKDNDGDGLTDYPLDPDCPFVWSAGEVSQCSDGIDGDIDIPDDFYCSSLDDPWEGAPPKVPALSGPARLLAAAALILAMLWIARPGPSSKPPA